MAQLRIIIGAPVFSVTVILYVIWNYSSCYFFRVRWWDPTDFNSSVTQTTPIGTPAFRCQGGFGFSRLEIVETVGTWSQNHRNSGIRLLNPEFVYPGITRYPSARGDTARRHQLNSGPVEIPSTYLRVLNYFIELSPPGQLHLVVDCKNKSTPNVGDFFTSLPIPQHVKMYLSEHSPQSTIPVSSMPLLRRLIAHAVSE